MDAVKFLTEKNRMCGSSKDCRSCELYKANCCSNYNIGTKAEKAVEIVERWSKEHQKKTRMSELLKNYPNVTIDTDDNFPIFYPCDMDHEFQGGHMCKESRCGECRRKYWTEEIE